MSLEAMTWAKRILAPSSGAKYTLFMLANYAGRKGESFYPLTDIADDMQISVDSVRRNLIQLQDAGMIARIARKRADGSRSSDLIVLLMDGETRAYAESLGWSAEPRGEAGSAERDPETPGIEPLANCDHPLAGCDHPLPNLQGGGSTGATPIMNQQLTNKITPTPAARGVSEVASLRDEAETAERRWEAFKAVWPFNPKASPGKARAAFMALSPQDREAAIRYAPRYLAATKGGLQKHAGNWLADRDWTGFVEQEAQEAQKQDRLRLLEAEQDARERARYGGVVIYPDKEMGRRQHAAWQRHDAPLGVDHRRELKSYPCGQGYVRPSRFPPGKGETVPPSAEAGSPIAPPSAEGEAREAPS